MLPGEGQSTSQVTETTTVDLIVPMILEVFTEVIVITTTSFIYSLMCLPRKHVKRAYCVPGLCQVLGRGKESSTTDGEVRRQ